MQLVVFELNKNEYGIDALSVNGILRAKKFAIQKMPGVVDSIEGVINVRGKISFVFNLGKKFKIVTTKIHEESKFIMINIGDVVAGCIADEVTDIIKIEDEAIQVAPSFTKQESYIKGIGKFEDRMIIILDSEKIISLEETEALKPDDIKNVHKLS
ncbi:MAG: chemotaxis protein CheW [Pelosinus sp.]|nr:chemotaxis protein CheW [Pelosinus sp.]